MGDIEWQTMWRLFHAAVETPSDERSAFLDDACGRATPLRERLDRLLAVNDRASDFLANPLDVTRMSELEGQQPPSPVSQDGVPPLEPEVHAGQQIDRYRLLKEVGEGRTATVFLAEDPKHQRKVALKILRPEFAAAIQAKRFLAEIRTTANLQHPHILPLHDSGESDGLLFYVMPYLEGESLRQKLEREGQLAVDEALHIAGKVASALQYAHEQNIIHRDIKPGNILLHAGEPVVTDFGIALALSTTDEGRLTKSGFALGTPQYMSPEQARAHRNLGPRSDIFSLGCVLYEMLVGQPPHTGPTIRQVLVKILTEEPRPLSELRPEIPAHTVAAVHRALNKLPADRFKSAEAFGSALEASQTRKALPRWWSVRPST